MTLRLWTTHIRVCVHTCACRRQICYISDNTRQFSFALYLFLLLQLSLFHRSGHFLRHCISNTGKNNSSAVTSWKICDACQSSVSTVRTTAAQWWNRLTQGDRCIPCPSADSLHSFPWVYPLAKNFLIVSEKISQTTRAVAGGPNPGTPWPAILPCSLPSCYIQPRSVALYKTSQGSVSI